MADVRNLLRNERASRRISHLYASYTKSGQLLCNVCQLFIKSESLWEGHLRSPNHKQNVQKAQNGRTTLEPSSKKRKLDDEEIDTRKKSRGDNEVREQRGDIERLTQKEGPQATDGTAKASKSQDIDRPPEEGQTSTNTVTTESRSAQAVEPSAPLGPKALVDEDEWAAFEREVVPLTQDTIAAPSRLESATISAAPMTAAEVAAQQDALRRPRRDEEIENEKEEEERRMEEEFEVMEEMEERVKKLKERREALRFEPKSKTNEAAATAAAGNIALSGVSGTGDRTLSYDTEQQDEQQSDEESGDDISDFDGWARH